MTELDILLPFGLPPPELAGDLLKELNTPSLAILASRTKSDGVRHETMDEFQRALPHELWMAQRFGMGGQGLRIAAEWMAELNLAPEPGCWFAVQPVHIHVARDHLVLTDPRQLSLSDDESRTLFDIAAPLFAEAGKRLLYGSATVWFVDANDWRELETSTPDAASGHNIDIWMPKGPGERDWRKVQNDVQMHWFEHAINADRETRGLKAVNSVWLWGGPSAAARERSRDYDKAFNLSGYLHPFRNLVTDHDRALDVHALLAAGKARSLLLIDTLLEPALSNDWGRWIEQIKLAEETWFSPLLEAVKSGSIKHLTLVATHDSRISRFTATRLSLRKFWVKPSLAPLCQ